MVPTGAAFFCGEVPGEGEARGASAKRSSFPCTEVALSAKRVVKSAGKRSNLVDFIFAS